MSKIAEFVAYKADLNKLIKEGHLLMIKLPSENNRKMNDFLTQLTKAETILETIIYANENKERS